MSFEVQLDVRNALYAHLVSLDLATHEGLGTGQLVSRATSDLGLLQQVLAWGPMVLASMIQALLSIAVMAVLNPWLMGLPLVVPAASFVASRRLRSTVYPSSRDAQQREGELTAVVADSVVGAQVVRAFAQEDHQVARFERGARTLYRARMRNIRLRASITAELQSIPLLVQAGILGLGGWLALHGEVTIGTFVAFASYLTQLAAPARMFAGILVVGQQALGGIDRIGQLLTIEPAIVEPAHPRTLPPEIGHVRLDVRARRGGDREVLRG